jgi:putative ABC transport system permease protein
MRTFLDIVTQTLRTLWAHKLRSFLTMFGIAWGVGSLLLLVGLGEGFRSGNRRELSTMGENIMFLFPSRAPAVEGSTQSGKEYFPTYRDYEDIMKEQKHLKAISPVLVRQDIRAASEFQNTNGQVAGVLPSFNEVRWLPHGAGRWLNDDDVTQRRLVAVLGYEMQKNLFPGRPSLGSTILLNGLRFEVVGILKTVGKDEGNTTNLRIFIPYSVMAQYFPLKEPHFEPDSVSFLNFAPKSRDEHDAAMTEVKKIVARNHGFDWKNDDAFAAWDTVKSSDMVGKIFDAMDMFLGGVGLVTLALGAIGIINIMLVSVTERTKEIGLRKAIGATNRNIMAQFFLEGTFLTMFSGGIGVAVAASICALLALLPAPPGFDTPRIVPTSAALAIGSLALAGIVAGLYPARKAALLPPVEALRKE